MASGSLDSPADMVGPLSPLGIRLSGGLVSVAVSCSTGDPGALPIHCIAPGGSLVGDLRCCAVSLDESTIIGACP